MRLQRITWLTLLILASYVGQGYCAKEKTDVDQGPDDNEDDIEPWPCPEGLTWLRCSVNLSCFEESEEEAMAKCGPGCYCPKRRFLYKGECLVKQECPEEECSDDMEYSNCNNYCDEMCPGVLPPTTCRSGVCYDGCFCKKGLKRFAGKCYKPEDCPEDPMKEIENFLLFNSVDPTPEEEKKRKFFLEGPMATGH